MASVPTPAPTAMLMDVSSTDTVPILGMFSRAVKSSHGKAVALISVEKNLP